MKANYHAHTYRCNHAVGREEDYVRQAIGAGFDIFGFADHAPYLFTGGYVSNIRMRPAQLAGYVNTLEGLRKTYAGQIEIPIGLEMEYYPKHFRDTIAFYRDYPIDYVILAQHFLENEYDAPYCGRASDDLDRLRAYCRQSMEAMQTGAYTYFAHPDLMYFHGDVKVYQEQMRALCREAKSVGLPLEINLLGLANGRNYPNRFFWEVAAGEGCQAILGWDAHAPENVNVPHIEAKARAMAKDWGIELLDTAELRKP